MTTDRAEMQRIAAGVAMRARLVIVVGILALALGFFALVASMSRTKAAMLADFRAAVALAVQLPTDWPESHNAFQKAPRRICELLCQSGDTNEWQVLLPAKMASALASMLPSAASDSGSAEEQMHVGGA